MKALLECASTPDGPYRIGEEKGDLDAPHGAARRGASRYVTRRADAAAELSGWLPQTLYVLRPR